MADFEINGDKVRSFRRARGWTQLELAVFAGISERTVRNAERSRPLRRDFLDFLATALHVEAEDLVSDAAALRPARRSERLAARVLAAFGNLYKEQNSRPFLELTHRQCDVSQQTVLAVPFNDSYSGADSISRFFDLVLPWAATLINHQFLLDPMRASGNLVILSGVSRWLSPEDGTPLHVRGTHIYQFDRERIHNAECYMVPCDPPQATATAFATPREPFGTS